MQSYFIKAAEAEALAQQLEDDLLEELELRVIEQHGEAYLQDDAIRNEIFLFDPEVGDKPEIVALNKVDASEAAAVKALKLQGEFRARGVDAHVVSALDGSGVAELVTATKDALEALPPIDYEEEARKAEARRGVVARRADGKELSDFEVIDEPYAFYVKGAAIERFVQMTNWDYFESFKRFAQVLKMSGVEKALNEAGAGEGDRIVIGKYEFEWSADNRTGAMYESWKAKQDEKHAMQAKARALLRQKSDGGPGAEAETNEEHRAKAKEAAGLEAYEESKSRRALAPVN